MITKRSVGVFEFALFRSVINMIMSAQVVRQNGFSFYECVPESLRCLMHWRSGITCLGFIAYTTAPMFIPIGVFEVIFNLAAFAAAIIAWAWLNEKITAFEFGALIVALFGVYLI